MQVSVWLAALAVGVPLAGAFTGPSFLPGAGVARPSCQSPGPLGAGVGMPMLRPGRQALCVAMSGKPTAGMSRKEKQRLKKKEKEEKRELRKQFRELTDTLVDDLMDEVESEKRDVKKIAESITKLKEVQKTMPVDQLEALKGDWKLAYTDSATTLNNFGTGLGSLPGTAIKEMFASFQADSKITVREICRVLGPFPNIRNQLDGTWTINSKGAAGFTGDSSQKMEGLVLRYEQLTDGRDKVTTASTGFKVKNIACEVGFVNEEILVMNLNGGDLVFETEPALMQEIGKLLRADLTKEGEEEEPPSGYIEKIAQVATGQKKAWDVLNPFK
mmetsp:Transcript_27489/g.67862  ORF Transcript_27489/g.67862 Transcript_27489/m.67862 type:complete len:330 (-) Transcript_27489:292-1281(-)